MKIKGTFVIHDIAGDIVIVPVGETALHYNGMITTTKTGAAIWKELENGCDREMLIDMLLKRFDVDRDTAANDTDEFLQQLKKAGFIQD